MIRDFIIANPTYIALCWGSAIVVSLFILGAVVASDGER